MSKKIGSPEDLRKLRDSSRRDMDLREGKRQVCLTVHMGTCGIAAGARDVLTGLMDELSDSGKANVTLTQSGCLGLCDQEPMMTLRDGVGHEFLYARLDLDRVRQIVRRHVLGGTPVVELIADSSPRQEGE